MSHDKHSVRMELSKWQRLFLPSEKMNHSCTKLMANKRFLARGLCIITVLIIIFRKGYVDPVEKLETDNVNTLTSRDDSKLKEMIEISKKLIKQRNDISMQLNLKQQTLGQQACQSQGKTHVATSETGGWCQNSSKEDGGQHMTDKPLANALASFFKGKKVASFGDGPGRYKQLLLDSEMVVSFDAFDGAPFCDTTSEGRVKFLDLTLSQYGLPLFDWVMSLEVAEHIPARFESIYIDNIVRHAREGVVISWAVPGQGGYSHVNNRPFEYVKTMMDTLGLYHDNDASEQLKKAATLQWLQTNTNVFKRRDIYKIDHDSAYFT